MNEEEVHEMVEKILKADKAITEQILGLEWTYPDLSKISYLLDENDNNNNNNVTKNSLNSPASTSSFSGEKPASQQEGTPFDKDENMFLFLFLFLFLFGFKKRKKKLQCAF